jgi:hypothetical protein
MEVRRRMIMIEHRHDDAEEPTDLGQGNLPESIIDELVVAVSMST